MVGSAVINVFILERLQACLLIFGLSSDICIESVFTDHASFVLGDSAVFVFLWNRDAFPINVLKIVIANLTFISFIAVSFGNRTVWQRGARAPVNSLDLGFYQSRILAQKTRSVVRRFVSDKTAPAVH